MSADVKNPARGHKVEKQHSKGKNVRRTLHKKRKRKWYKKILGKSGISKKKHTCNFTGGRILAAIRAEAKQSPITVYIWIFRTSLFIL